MKDLILDARKLSLDLRVDEHTNENEPYDICAIEIHDMVKESADMIDRLTVALMMSEETIVKLSKMLQMPDEDTQAVLRIIGTADAKMIEAYSTIRKE